MLSPSLTGLQMCIWSNLWGYFGQWQELKTSILQWQDSENVEELEFQGREALSQMVIVRV